MRPFRCPVTILNTIDHLGKLDGKVDEGFFVGYSLNSKAFRVFNSRIRIVEENLHIRFSENTPNVIGTISNGFAGTKVSDNASQARKETKFVKDYILLPLWTTDPSFFQDPKSSHDNGFKPSSDDEKKFTINVAGINEDNELPIDPNMLSLEDVSTFNFLSNDEDDGIMADMNNLDTTIQVAQGHIQEEGIDYDEVFSPVARIKAIRLFLAYASFKDFVMYQMDVRSAFLYGKIEEVVYVCQPLGFKHVDFPDRVYKVEKALYGLHQAPRA
nr:retrovirus-related Pol polyprotein from transposon TNT 1-94 [Tanacetum cinerariifolium]